MFHGCFCATQLSNFRFARIMYANADKSEVHIQWLEHGCKTFLEELGHPQELFYCNTCTSIPFQQVIGKVQVREVARGQSTPTLEPHEFFVK